MGDLRVGRIIAAADAGIPAGGLGEEGKLEGEEMRDCIVAGEAADAVVEGGDMGEEADLVGIAGGGLAVALLDQGLGFAFKADAEDHGGVEGTTEEDGAGDGVAGEEDFALADMVDLEVERHRGWGKRAAMMGFVRWEGDGLLAIGNIGFTFQK